MIEIGRICLKVAGRDAAKKCVVVDIIDERNVIIDGETRRRKCNIKHLEPTKIKIPIKKGAPHAEVIKEFSKLGIIISDKKPKKQKPKPKKLRKKDKK
ncbi:MAG: 50S ribosomal protein L14e [Candidatus Woesearchaeota archaeon]